MISFHHKGCWDSLIPSYHKTTKIKEDILHKSGKKSRLALHSREDMV